MKYVTSLSVVFFFFFFFMFGGWQCMEHSMMCLEEQQDEFDFKYKTYLLEGKQRACPTNLESSLRMSHILFFFCFVDLAWKPCDPTLETPPQQTTLQINNKTNFSYLSTNSTRAGRLETVDTQNEIGVSLVVLSPFSCLSFGSRERCLAWISSWTELRTL